LKSGSTRRWSRNSSGSSARSSCIWITARRSKCSSGRTGNSIPGRAAHRPAVAPGVLRLVPRFAPPRHGAACRLRPRLRAHSAYVTGLANLRDAIPFPRTSGNGSIDASSLAIASACAAGGRSTPMGLYLPLPAFDLIGVPQIVRPGIPVLEPDPKGPIVDHRRPGTDDLLGQVLKGRR